MHQKWDPHNNGYHFCTSLNCVGKQHVNEYALCYEGAWPEHHCKIPDGALINETIPLKDDGSYDSCHVYAGEDRNETTKCNEWKYYYGDIGPTIVSKVILPSMNMHFS